MEGSTGTLKRSRSLSIFKLFSRRSSSASSDDLHRHPLPTSQQQSQQQQNSPQPEGRGKRRPTHTQRVLPQEIHDNILRYVRAGHETGNDSTCSTCLARDLSAYSRVCKSWHAAVIPQMYQKIWINGAEAPMAPKKPKRKDRETGRVAALLRTLEDRPDYAFHVRELKLPEFQRTAAARQEAERLVDTAASIIRCCVSLERFVGPYTSVGGGWSSPINKALSACPMLREHVLIFGEDGGSGRPKLERSREFAQLHEHWVNLETLVLQGCGQEPDVDFVGAFVNLPRLKNLMISNFRLGEAAALALQAIPASVTHLRLESLRGLTGRALNGFAVSRKAKGLQSLALVNIPFPRIHDLVPVFRLRNLESLAIADSLNMPYFDEDELTTEAIPQISANIFTSQTLQTLHWDILVHPVVEAALAASISTGKLPALNTLRAPSDRHGTLQAACRPLAGIAFPSDSIWRESDEPSQNTQKNSNTLPFSRSLPSARVRAQKRIDRAKQDICMQIHVTEDGKIKETHTMRAFMGNVKSNVTYTLSPDHATTLEEKGRDSALVSFEKDVLDAVSRKELDVGSGMGREVCSGGWNAKSIGTAGRKERKNSLRALHTDRRKVETGRIELQRLF
ncbi:hypothetical protein DFH27DRAFT_475068 [Peziza echinospora]|nr:hypothetical protein DFH27DRAFT_475068 [Peziza echinospora]